MNETSAGPAAKTDLVQRVQERYGQLRPSERIVADYLREHAGRRLDLSITELAQVLGLSEATISRVSRALGYAGFSDLKLSLAEGAVGRSQITNIPAELVPSDDILTTSATLSVLLSASIQGTQRMLNAESLNAAVDALRQAQKVVLAGVGGAAAICDEAVHIFMKAGLDATSYSDGYSQVVAAANLSPDCLMIGISHTGTTNPVAQALTLARRNGAMTIAITSDSRSIVAKAAEIVLTTWTSATPSVPLHGDYLEGRVSQMFLIDLLYLGLLFEKGAKRVDHLRITADALAQYFRVNQDPN
jgi:RpiR family transcriptional regulator, carbohydrate utilization regulator